MSSIVSQAASKKPHNDRSNTAPESGNFADTCLHTYNPTSVQGDMHESLPDRVKKLAPALPRPQQTRYPKARKRNASPMTLSKRGRLVVFGKGRKSKKTRHAVMIRIREV